MAFLWPFSDERYFAPFQMIQVSPIGIHGFLSEYGMRVVLSEPIWVWIPCALLTGMLLAVRRSRARG